VRVGTPGFVAQRLTEAREARGLAQTALSELTGIKSQSISHYEQGRQSPSPEALLLLCEKLDVPERYFLQPMPAKPPQGIYFRSLRPQTRATRVKAAHHIGWLKEIAAYLGRHIDLPAYVIPNLPVSPSEHECGPEIEKTAELCRRQLHLGHGPVHGLVALAENNGCIVARGGSDSERESACSHFSEDRAYILLSGDGGSGHTRFDAAHEIGHLVMHRDVQPESVDSETHRILEQQADRFARAFLLPAETFGREVWAPTVDALLSLRRQWNCPLSAMITRCGEIGAFAPDQVRRASANLARRGWKAGEPPEDSAPGESPQLLARCFRLLVEGGVKDRHDLVTDLSLSPSDIESLAGLPRHYLSESDTPLPALLRLRPPA
jgi:Zn-dependent peptidase ImmA (M78 family)/transcriptional regulator with XRE-family HTH domain